MPRIFISYRRDDSAYAAAQIAERLRQQFGEESVFFDVASIPVGENIPMSIRRAIGQCDVMLAIIGSDWMGSGEDDQRRIDVPEDFVRLEVEAAIACEVPVIPVLVDNASLPPKEALPESIQFLLDLNAAQVRPGSDREPDLSGLICTVSERAATVTSTEPRQPLRGWVWVSSTQSAAGRIPSVLAMLETTVLTALYSYLLIRTNFATELVVPLVLAPLALIRVRAAPARAASWIGRAQQLVDRMPPWTQLVYFFTLLVPTVVVARSAAVGWSGLVSFREMVGAIPENWQRICLCTDLVHPPQVVPGIDEHPELDSLSDDIDAELRRIFMELFSIQPRTLMQGSDSLFAHFAMAPVLLMLADAAVLYRYSVKATSVVWAPLLFASRAAASGATNPQWRLQLLDRGTTHRVAMAFALFTLIGFALKFWFAPSLAAAPDSIRELLGTPTVIYPWQIAAVANAVLVLYLHTWANSLLLDNKKSYLRQGYVRQRLAWTAWFRTVLAFYTAISVLAKLVELSPDLLSGVEFRWILLPIDLSGTD